MGLEFIQRSLKTTGLLLLIYLPVGLYYTGLFPMLSVLSGGVWGIINFILITKLVRLTIRPEGVDGYAPVLVVLGLMLALFVAGYFLLSVEKMSPIWLLVGFNSLFFVILLKAVGGVITKADTKPTTDTAVKAR